MLGTHGEIFFIETGAEDLASRIPWEGGKRAGRPRGQMRGTLTSAREKRGSRLPMHPPLRKVMEASGDTSPKSRSLHEVQGEESSYQGRSWACRPEEEGILFVHKRCRRNGASGRLNGYLLGSTP